MTLWAAVTFLVTSIGVITSAAFVVFAVPRSARAGYRAELWGVRDRLVDSLINGEISPSPAAAQMLNVIERHILESPTFVAWRIVAFLLQRRGMPVPESPLTPGVPDHRALQAIEDEVVEISSRAISRTSWLGRVWIVWVPIVVWLSKLPDYFVVPDDDEDAMEASVRTVMEVEFATQTAAVPSGELAHCF